MCQLLSKWINSLFSFFPFIVWSVQQQVFFEIFNFWLNCWTSNVKMILLIPPLIPLISSCWCWIRFDLTALKPAAVSCIQPDSLSSSPEDFCVCLLLWMRSGGRRISLAAACSWRYLSHGMMRHHSRALAFKDNASFFSLTGILLKT